MLDFALWERDRLPPSRSREWLEAMAPGAAGAIGEWLAGLDAELVALILLRGAHLRPHPGDRRPTNPKGISFPRPTLFVLDVRGAPESDERASPPAPGQEHNGVAVMIRREARRN